ncbi:MAG: hypothetical protein HFH32_04895 [Eubacterium sp.]|jgi:hypothetical protein|nr:hypothetical protein [Eubacterium sp.]
MRHFSICGFSAREAGIGFIFDWIPRRWFGFGFDWIPGRGFGFGFDWIPGRGFGFGFDWIPGRGMNMPAVPDCSGSGM